MKVVLMEIKRALSSSQIRFNVTDLLQDTLLVGGGKPILQLNRLVIIFTCARCWSDPN